MQSVKSNQLGQHIAAYGAATEIFMPLMPREFTPKVLQQSV